MDFFTNPHATLGYPTFQGARYLFSCFARWFSSHGESANRKKDLSSVVEAMHSTAEVRSTEREAIRACNYSALLPDRPFSSSAASWCWRDAEIPDPEAAGAAVTDAGGTPRSHHCARIDRPKPTTIRMIIASVGLTGVCASGRNARSLIATYSMGPSAAADIVRIAQGAQRAPS